MTSSSSARPMKPPMFIYLEAVLAGARLSSAVHTPPAPRVSSSLGKQYTSVDTSARGPFSTL